MPASVRAFISAFALRSVRHPQHAALVLGRARRRCLVRGLLLNLSFGIVLQHLLAVLGANIRMLFERFALILTILLCRFLRYLLIVLNLVATFGFLQSDKVQLPGRSCRASHHLAV